MTKKKVENLDSSISEKKPVCFFTIAYGEPHIKEYAKKMRNSLDKFHPDIPHFFMGDEETKDILKAHPLNKHRMYPIFGAKLAEEYELVIQIDNDCIVTGNLDHIINDKSYEVGGVLNNNLIDPKLTVRKKTGEVLDIQPEYYMNAGFIAIRGERPWNWWLKLCSSNFFMNYQFIEQDMLNIMCHYGDLRVKIFDFSKYWHGLVHKGQWHKFILKEDKIYFFLQSF